MDGYGSEKRDVRDKGDIPDLDDFSGPKVFFLLVVVGGCRLVLTKGETKRVQGMAPQRDPFLQRCPRVHPVVVFLEIAVGVIAVIVGALTLVDGFGEILRFRLRKRS